MTDHDDGERGSITFWLLGTGVMVLFLAGLSVDLWHATAQRRALAGLADAAATAAAGAIDEPAFRSHGLVHLDPDAAEARAVDLLTTRTDATGLPVIDASVAATVERVEVVVHGEVDVTLLRVLQPGVGAWAIQVRAAAEPRVGAEER